MNYFLFIFSTGWNSTQKKGDVGFWISNQVVDQFSG